MPKWSDPEYYTDPGLGQPKYFRDPDLKTLPTGEEEEVGEQDELDSCVDNRLMPVDANSNFCSVSSSCDKVKTTTELVEDSNNGLEPITSPTALSDLESQQMTECLPLTELCSFAQPVIPSGAVNNNKNTPISHQNGVNNSEVESRGAVNFRLGAYESGRVCPPPPRSPAVEEGGRVEGRGSPRGALRRQHGKRYEKVR
jgi:hypothetical protein